MTDVSDSPPAVWAPCARILNRSASPRLEKPKAPACKKLRREIGPGQRLSSMFIKESSKDSGDYLFIDRFGHFSIDESHGHVNGRLWVVTALQPHRSAIRQEQRRPGGHGPGEFGIACGAGHGAGSNTRADQAQTLAPQRHQRSPGLASKKLDSKPN